MRLYYGDPPANDKFPVMVPVIRVGPSEIPSKIERPEHEGRNAGAHDTAAPHDEVDAEMPPYVDAAAERAPAEDDEDFGARPTQRSAGRPYCVAADL